MFDFAGIAHDATLLQSIRQSTELSSYSEHVHASGFRGGGANRSWRSDFSLRDAWGFMRSAGDLLIELGYERDRRWWMPRVARADLRRRVSAGLAPSS